MKLLDNSAISHILTRNMHLTGNYYITPDIEHEMTIAEMVLNRIAPKNIRNLLTGELDDSLYLQNYFYALNKHGGRSFFNMTGFGDVSLIAAAMTLLQQGGGKHQLAFPGLSREIFIYTDDRSLTRRLNQEFGNKVTVYTTDKL